MFGAIKGAPKKAAAAVRRALLIEFMKGLISDLVAGEYGEEGKAAMLWIRENKAKVGLVAAFVAGGLRALGHLEAAHVVEIAAGIFLGGGLLKRDADAKAGR